MLVAGVKSFDLLLGFIVAKTSDGLRTRWGRRKPFIALAFPLALCAMLVFVNAPALGATVSDAEPKAAPCTELVRHSDDDAGCPALKACLAAAITAGELPPPENNGAAPIGGASEPAGWLTPYFVLTYFWFIVTTWTCSQIPYDALGLELAPGYHERATLYGVKTLFQFTGAASVPRASTCRVRPHSVPRVAGYAIAPALGLALSPLFAGDVAGLYATMAAVFAAIGVCTYSILLYRVKERRPRDVAPRKRGDAAPLVADGLGPSNSPSAEPSRVPFVPAARRVLGNRPYRIYLMMKVQPCPVCSSARLTCSPPPEGAACRLLADAIEHGRVFHQAQSAARGLDRRVQPGIPPSLLPLPNQSSVSSYSHQVLFCHSPTSRQYHHPLSHPSPTRCSSALWSAG